MDLDTYLKAHGITQAQFAKRLGRTQSAVSLWCSGRRKPSLTTAFKILALTDGAVPVSAWFQADTFTSQAQVTNSTSGMCAD